MGLRIYYNPLDTACKSVIGAVCQRETIQFNLFLLNGRTSFEANTTKTISAADCKKPDKKAYFRINADGEAALDIPMTETDFGWSVSVTIQETGLYFYHFTVEGEGNVCCGHLEMGVLTERYDGFMLTVYSENYKTPDWFKGGVMYQIFPDRFCRKGSMPDIEGRISRDDWGGMPTYRPNAQGKVLNNDFFGGNFKGIESKLPYLKDLGVTVIYLNPIFEAASNHRYDTSDYLKLDPVLGSEADFASLIKEAKKYGIRLILDGVFNHTGDDSVYFNKYGHYSSVGAYQSKESPYYSWYSFQNFPDRYSSWWGIDILPEVNENSQAYQNFIFGKDGVLKKWLKFGIGGYRLDVADELPDFFLKKLRDSVKESDSEAIIIGEVWEDASNKIAYSKRREYLHGHELDSVMNYPLKDAIISYIQTENAENLLRTMRALINHYPKKTLDCLMNILGTHDTARILTVLGGIYCKNKDEMASRNAYLTPENKGKAIKKLKMAAVLQFTLPGVPSIYYGDENGMEGHIDPFCRQCFDWNNLNIDLIDFYKTLGKIRNEYHSVFKDGIFKDLRTEEGLIFYKRTDGKDSVYIYANNSSKRYLLNISGNFADLINHKLGKDQLEIQPYSYGIFIKL